MCRRAARAAAAAGGTGAAGFVPCRELYWSTRELAGRCGKRRWQRSETGSRGGKNRRGKSARLQNSWCFDEHGQGTRHKPGKTARRQRAGGSGKPRKAAAGGTDLLIAHLALQLYKPLVHKKAAEIKLRNYKLSPSCAKPTAASHRLPSTTHAARHARAGRRKRCMQQLSSAASIRWPHSWMEAAGSNHLGWLLRTPRCCACSACAGSGCPVCAVGALAPHVDFRPRHTATNVGSSMPTTSLLSVSTAAHCRRGSGRWPAERAGGSQAACHISSCTCHGKAPQGWSTVDSGMRPGTNNHDGTNRSARRHRARHQAARPVMPTSAGGFPGLHKHGAQLQRVPCRSHPGFGNWLLEYRAAAQQSRQGGAHELVGGACRTWDEHDAALH